MATNYPYYLTLKDYLPSINDNQLNTQILDPLLEGNMERMSAEQWATGKFIEHTGGIYDVEFELTPTLPFDPLKTYTAGDRVSLLYDLWVSKKSYKQNDCCVSPTDETTALRCLEDNNDETFNADRWEVMGSKFDLFYIKFPYPVFCLDFKQKRGITVDGLYKANESIVFWNGKTYLALQDSFELDHVAAIQYAYYSDFPHNNVFPDDPNSGANYWKDLGAYEIKDEFPSVNSEVWTLGDNRNSLVVKCIVDLSLWLLHDRITPGNVPKKREDNKNASFAWLRDIQRGNINLDIQIMQPIQNETFDGGSKVKQRNGYV